MDDFNVGPALVYYGDPTQANGAGMNFLGHYRGDATVDPQISVAKGYVDAKGITPLADAVFYNGVQPIANIPFVDEEAEKLSLLMPGSKVVTNGSDKTLLLGTGVKKIPVTDINTLCILPVDEVDQGTNGVDADHAWWFPRAITQTFGNFTYALQDSADDVLSNQTRDTTIASLYHATDQAGNTLSEDARAGFRGSPKGAGLSDGDWSLPDHSANL